jgi:hypothetical protein
LRAFDNTNNRQLEWKVKKRPDLLTDSSVMAVGEVVEVQCPDEDLRNMASAYRTHLGCNRCAENVPKCR